MFVKLLLYDRTRPKVIYVASLNSTQKVLKYMNKYKRV